MGRILYLPILSVLIQDCGLQERELQIAKREKKLRQKESELLIKEQRLMLKEQSLYDKQLFLNSTRKQIDAINSYNPDVVGTRAVKIRCSGTSCDGAAIGDTQNEQWQISYDDDNTVIVKAFGASRLSRLYTGRYMSGNLELNDETAKHASLAFTGKGKMKGTREITQERCKIIYGLTAGKLP